MYFAPAQPYLRARSYLNRFRGIDTGTLSGRQVIEARERDIERISKYLLETEYFDTARTGIRGRCTRSLFKVRRKWFNV